MIDNSLVQYLYKMKHTDRYSTLPVITKENEAEHSYYVSLFSLMICDELNVTGEQRNKVLEMAITNSIPTATTGSITCIAKGTFKQFGINVDDCNPSIMQAIIPPYAEHVDEYQKQTTIEAAIVNVAKTVQSLQYCLHERALGNSNVDEIIDELLVKYDMAKQVLKENYELETVIFDD